MKKIFILFSMFWWLPMTVSFASAQFGTGTDGALYVATNTTDYTDDVRSAVSGTNSSGTSAITVQDASGFNTGDEIIIISMQDNETDLSLSTVGLYEFAKVQSVAGNVLNLAAGTTNSYDASTTDRHQVIRVPNYTNVDVNGTLACRDWDGSTGGVLVFRATGLVDVAATGAILAAEKGYRGGRRGGPDVGYHGYRGESYVNYSGGQSTSAYHNAGGGGTYNHGGSGGGGGFATSGSNGVSSNRGTGGAAAFTGNWQNRLIFGGGAGSGAGSSSSGSYGGDGGNGGGVLYILAHTIANQGMISAKGRDGESPGDNGTLLSSLGGAGGGGAGGYLNIIAATISNSGTLSAQGGASGPGGYYGIGGSGSAGRMRLDVLNLNNTGIVSPAALQGTPDTTGIVHLPQGNTPDETGPYVINAAVTDGQGDTITSVMLHYRTNGGSYTSVAMTNTAGNNYTGSIPGQALNTSIEYYITATDGADSYESPIGAPQNLHAFSIIALPPDDLTIVDNNDGTVTLNWNHPSDTSGLLGYSVYRSEIQGFVPAPSNRLSTGSVDTFFTDATPEDFHMYYYKVAADYNLGGTPTSSMANIDLLVNNHNITTVKGFALLENQSNHANIKVRFVPASPSAVLDSALTDALGYYEHAVNPGLYTVVYEKAGFQNYERVTSYSILDDTDLGTGTVLSLGTTGVSGNVSGTWSGIYSITGNITVPQGDSLIVMPGTQIRFLGNYHFYVNGYLAIMGAAGDSCRITSSPNTQGYARGQWRGIDFNDPSNNSSFIDHTIIEYAEYAIWAINCTPAVTNSRIRENSNTGIYCEDNAHMTINTVEIRNNTSYGMYIRDAARPDLDHVKIINSGRGIETSSPGVFTMDNCVVRNNTNYGVVLNSCSPIITDCELRNNTNDGLYCASARPQVIDCEIRNNSRHGVNFDNNSSATIDGCYIYQNSSQGVNFGYRNSGTRIRNNVIMNNSYGIYCNSWQNHTFYIENNVIAYNTNDGIYKNSDNNDPIIRYNTIYSNGGDGIEINNNDNSTESLTNNIMVNNSGYGLRSNEVVETLEYNNIFANTAGEISNLSKVPVNTWDFVSFNANGTSADVYLNISVDPLFELANANDLDLLASSPMIDAGAPSKLDPDGTVSDIGAIYHDQGNPHSVWVTGYADSTVSLAWDSVQNDSSISYNVYFKNADSSSYNLFATTTALSADVTGLTNNVLYDFTISTNYANTESIKAPKVSEKPGGPIITLDPVAFDFTIPAAVDTATEVLTVNNAGSRELNIDIQPVLTQGSVQFDGSGDRVDLGNPPAVDGMSELTIEFWIKKIGSNATDVINKHYHTYNVYFNNSLGFNKGYNTTYQTWTSGYSIPLNEWHHIAITWKGNDLKFYADGNQVYHVTNANSNPIPNRSDAMYFGYGNWHGQYLNGNMSEIRIWSEHKTATEIRNNMYLRAQGNEANLVGYWPLHENFNDVTANAANGWAVGNTTFNANESAPNVFIVDNPQVTVPAGGSVDVDFRFPNLFDGTLAFTTPIGTDDLNVGEIDYAMSVTYGENVPATPVHFQPVAATSKPYTIIVQNAEIDASTISVGDEIGVFDDTLCVGAGLYDGNFNFKFTIYEEDTAASLPGFKAGNAITFRMYDTSADLEAETEASYIIGDGTFGYGEFSSVELTGTVFKLQPVPVVGGQFNMVSFNQLPRYPASSVVFGGLDSMKIAYNDRGGAIIPEFNINSIGDIDFRDGFHLFSTENDTIEFEGTTINPIEWFIELEANQWNSIAFLSEKIIPVIDAFPDTLEDSISIVQAADGGVWIPSVPVNTLVNMRPGLGYQVALSSGSNITFSYQDNIAKSTLERPFVQVPQHFKFKTTGLPYTIVAELNSDQLKWLNSGDEIAVFDGDRCVGAAVYNGDNTITITAWEGFADLNLPGFEKGKAMFFKAYSSLLQKELMLSAVSLNPADQLTFKGAAYAHVALEGRDELTNANQISAYPNPFAQETSISFLLNETTEVKLSITDVSGKVVTNLFDGQLDRGIQQFSWKGQADNAQALAEGIYLYQLEIDGNRHTGRLVLMK